VKDLNINDIKIIIIGIENSGKDDIISAYLGEGQKEIKDEVSKEVVYFS